MGKDKEEVLQEFENNIKEYKELHKRLDWVVSKANGIRKNPKQVQELREKILELRGCIKQAEESMDMRKKEYFEEQSSVKQEAEEQNSKNIIRRKR